MSEPPVEQNFVWFQWPNGNMHVSCRDDLFSFCRYLRTKEHIGAKDVKRYVRYRGRTDAKCRCYQCQLKRDERLGRIRREGW